MAKYRVTRTYWKDVEVETNSPEEALKKVKTDIDDVEEV